MVFNCNGRGFILRSFNFLVSSSVFTVIFFATTITQQGCVYHPLPVPVNCNSNPIVLEVLSIEDTGCALKEGSIALAVSGGTGIYRYKLNDSEEQSGSFFSGLGAGIYEITALDDNNCAGTIEVIVKNKDGMNIEFETTESGCQSTHGSITVTPVNGIPPYNFKINDGDFQSGNIFNNLSRGQYTIVVVDSTGCEVSLSVKIKSGISFSASISPIIQNNCVISGCHNGSQFPDFRVFQNIRDNASRIKTQTVSRNMPQDGMLTQSEISAIVCWVDDGAPDN